MTHERESIDAFLAKKRVLFVGVSATPEDFSRAVWKALVDHGYDVVGVNPHGGAIDGRDVVASIEAAPTDRDWALVMTPPSASEGVVRACAAKGLRHVWLHRGAGEGSVSDGAVAAGNELGLEMVVGRCPLMFLEPSETVHKVHAGLVDLAGHYPHRTGEEGRSIQRVIPSAVIGGVVSALALVLVSSFVLPGYSSGEVAVVATMVGFFGAIFAVAQTLKRRTGGGR